MSPLSALLVLLAHGLAQDSGAGDPLGEPPVRAPFEGLDTLCVNDWWNRGPNPIVTLAVPREEVVAFGIYTVDAPARILKLTAQLFPLYPDETRTVRLELEVGGAEGPVWVEVGRREVSDLGWSTTFRVEGWDSTRDVRYRLRHGPGAVFEGLVRRDPGERGELVLAALSCNSNRDRGLREDYVRNLAHQDPDLLFFAGDQSYDHAEHTAAWLKFGLQFRELFRERPCITIPDDHDVGQGNLWGEGGKASTLRGGSDGGYTHHPAYVRMVERQQTAHLPDPVDPRPVGQGIGVYFTRLVWGGVDFAILEDRKFKSGPAGKLPGDLRTAGRPDHVDDPGLDPARLDVPGLTLLGGRQLAFLERWAAERGGMKAVLSQTGFCGGAHLHGSLEGRLRVDLDSNGWPQAGRRRALELVRAAGAVHVAGDQHLGTVVQHGLDSFRDGPWAFVVPAVVNDYYGRWWWPEGGAPGMDRDPASALPWTGDYLDGFGNRITMHAYANPESAAGGAGWGLVRFDKARGTVRFECWPRDADVTAAGAEQFPGWPITVEPGR